VKSPEELIADLLSIRAVLVNRIDERERMASEMRRIGDDLVDIWTQAVGLAESGADDAVEAEALAAKLERGEAETRRMEDEIRNPPEHASKTSYMLRRIDLTIERLLALAAKPRDRDAEERLGRAIAQLKRELDDRQQG